MSGFRPTGPSACLYAEIDVVIDTIGMPIRHTAKVARTNDGRYADIAQSALAASTFVPARKNGRPVMQVFRFSMKAQMRIVVAPAGTMPSRPSASRPPVC